MISQPGSLQGKNNNMNQNCSVAINPWWVSHLLLIENCNIHFWGTSCLVCLTSLLTDSTLWVFFSFAPLKALKIFTELLLITAFPSQVLFSGSPLIQLCSFQLWFDFAPCEIRVIRKSKHPPGLSLIDHVFSGVHCLRQLALRDGVLGRSTCLYCMLTDNSLWGRNSAVTQRQ